MGYVSLREEFAGGYYYDGDLSLYYLNSRYYDSNVGRFVNVDGQLNTVTILGYNLFCYCENNPVMRKDSEGFMWKKITSIGSKLFNKVEKVAYAAYYTATEWHFETREKLNGEHPTYEEVQNEIFN